MTVYEVFACCVKYRYKTTVCSNASVFVIFLFVFTFLAPFFIICRSNGFWLRTATYREQPEVHFKEKYILIAETTPLAPPVICSTYSHVNEFLGYGHCVLVKSRESDDNDDGKPDSLQLEFSLQIEKDMSVLSVKLLMVFDYKLHRVSSFAMESLGYLHYSSGLPGARYDVIADLHLVQREPLSTHGKDIRYNASVISEESLKYNTFDLLSTIREYSKRNVSSKLGNVYSLWTTGLASDSPFIVSVVIHYPEENITYVPRFWQIAKWAWIQYVSVLVVFIYVCRSIKTYVFCNHLVPTIKYIPWQKSL